ncbi:hypothetical protein ABPG74_015003 [Tetrahymena malaccensis]
MNRMNPYDSKNNDPIREKLRQLEEKSVELQKQGKYGESLDVLEEAFNLKINAYGEESEEVLKTSEKLCELCNLIAMLCLTRGKNEACFEFLKKARVLCENSYNFKAVTYNNMACYYKRINKNRVALDYLKKALEIEIHIDRPQSLADTHLNLCAVLSQLERHKEALEHVLMSIVLLQEEHMQNVLQYGHPRQRQQQNMHNSENQDPNDNEEGDYQNHEQKGQQNGDGGNRNFDDRIAVLAIAYHNMGVELEFLSRFEEAIQAYKKAVNFSITYLGESHSLVENLKGVLAQAENQIQSQKSKEIRRREGKDINKKPSIRINQAQTVYNTSDVPYKRATTAKSAPGGGNFRITSAQTQNNPQYKTKLPSMQYQQNQGTGGNYQIQGARSPTQQRPYTSNYPSQGSKNMNQGQMNQNYYQNNQYDQYTPQNQQQSNYQMQQNNQQYPQNEMLNPRIDHSRNDISPDQYSNQNN